MRFLPFLLLGWALFAQTPLPTNAFITPDAAKGSHFSMLDPKLPHLPQFRAGQAVATALSPDERTLLILTSGFNRMNQPDGTIDPNASNEYLFVFDTSVTPARQKQVLQLPNTFYGLAWHPKGDRFYVSGGVDDTLYAFEQSEGLWNRSAALKLGHSEGLGIDMKPMAAEIAINTEGNLAAITNMINDSLTLIDLEHFSILDEQDLRPGKQNAAMKGVAGGEYPFGVAFAGDKLYVTSMRDNEIVVLHVKNKRLSITARIPSPSQPTRLLVHGHELFIAQSRSDTIGVIDTRNDAMIGTFSATAPYHLLNQTHLKGANPNAMTLSDDANTLYVTNGGINAVAVIDLRREHGRVHGEVRGLIPTGWYPTDLSLKENRLYVINAKSPSGPNVGDCRDNLSTDKNASLTCKAKNLYTWQTKKAGFLELPLPSTEELERLSLIVAHNNGFIQSDAHKKAQEAMSFLRSKIEHVIYLVKENRSYDQIHGAMEIGDGNASLCLFPEPVTPNHHALARHFILFDNFLDSGSSSNDGWVWTTAGHTTEYTEKNIAIHYAGRGLSYDNEGQNRNLNLGLADPLERTKEDVRAPSDPDLLPGIADVAAPDGPNSAPNAGYIWDAALRAGLEVRNYGFYVDEERYYLDPKHPSFVKLHPRPFEANITQSYPNKASLRDVTDRYFHGYDMKYPDLWRYDEWKREFDGYVQKGALPQLMLVRFPHDHFGAFGEAVAGVNTPLAQMADNDYATGLLVEAIARSPFAHNTLIFIIEDDAQDGADHVDSHRSVAYIVGPYVKQGAVINTRYTTVSMLRTIEEVLGLQPLGINDAMALPMSEAFDPKQQSWSYQAIVPDVLYHTDLSLPKRSKKEPLPPKDHDYGYWERVMAGQDFNTEDNLDAKAFNKALWNGLKSEPLPPQLQGE
ncbi:MAG: hypothetical protein JXK05_02100 [Campylobacterales bacterium]|nr:hypothetical protein [Campylobacterales bacterium]